MAVSLPKPYCHTVVSYLFLFFKCLPFCMFFTYCADIWLNDLFGHTLFHVMRFTCLVNESKFMLISHAVPVKCESAKIQIKLRSPSNLSYRIPRMVTTKTTCKWRESNRTDHPLHLIDL